MYLFFQLRIEVSICDHSLIHYLSCAINGSEIRYTSVNKDEIVLNIKELLCGRVSHTRYVLELAAIIGSHITLDVDDILAG